MMTSSYHCDDVIDDADAKTWHSLCAVPSVSLSELTQADFDDLDIAEICRGTYKSNQIKLFLMQQ